MEKFELGEADLRGFQTNEEIKEYIEKYEETRSS